MLTTLLAALLTLLGLLLTIGLLLTVALLIHLVLIAVLPALVPIRHVVHSCLFALKRRGRDQNEAQAGSFRLTRAWEPKSRYCEIATKHARRWQFARSVAREAPKSI